MTWRVLATPRHFDLTPEPEAYLRQHGCDLVTTEYGGALNDAQLAGKELIDRLGDVDAAIIGRCPMTREVIEAAPSLKLIARRGVGYATRA